jgi:uncharacterized integral membrane protein
MVFLYVLFGLLGAMTLVFAVQNPDPVSLTFFDWHTPPLPQALLLLLAASVGVVCAPVSGFAQQFQLKGKVRRLETRLAVLTRELDAPFCEPTRLEQVVPPRSPVTPVVRSRIM